MWSLTLEVRIGYTEQTNVNETTSRRCCENHLFLQSHLLKPPQVKHHQTLRNVQPTKWYFILPRWRKKSKSIMACFKPLNSTKESNTLKKKLRWQNIKFWAHVSPIKNGDFPARHVIVYWSEPRQFFFIPYLQNNQPTVHYHANLKGPPQGHPKK